MKYQLLNFENKNHANLMVENVVPTKTCHILGYGVGVTFSSTSFEWRLDSTFSNIRLTGFTRPTFVSAH